MAKDLKQRWAVMWAKSRKWRDPIPLSLTGILLIFAAFAARKYWGVDQSDFVIRSASTLMLITIGTMILSVVTAALILRNRISQLPDASLVGSVEAGDILDDGLKFTRFRWWPFVQTDLEWCEPARFEIKLEATGSDWLERVRPLERGRIERVTRRFTVRDIFGLASISMIRSWPAGIRVLPRRSPFRIEEILRNVAEDGFAHPSGQPVGDIIEMRRYAPGDPLNRIVWRTFARNRELYVREPERSISPLPTNAIYFVAGAGDEGSAEHVRSMLEQNLLGDEIIFGADGSHEAAYSRDGALELLIRSAHARDKGGQGLEHFAQVVNGHHGARCLVCLPGANGPWTQYLERFIRSLTVPPAFLITVNGQMDLPTPSQRWIWQSDAKALFDGQALRQLHGRLEAMGGPVEVINAGPGRRVSRSEIIAMGQR